MLYGCKEDGIRYMKRVYRGEEIELLALKNMQEDGFGGELH